MPALIAPGAEVRTYASADGTTQVQCPACGHTIPSVPHDALTLADHRPTCTPIHCACPDGLGMNSIGWRVTCPCRAVFRLQPQGTARYVVVEGHQEPASEVDLEEWAGPDPHATCPCVLEARNDDEGEPVPVAATSKPARKSSSRNRKRSR